MISIILQALPILIAGFAILQTNKSLRITQGQFEISNMPLLQLEFETQTESKHRDLPTELKFRIKNLGKFPVKIEIFQKAIAYHYQDATPNNLLTTQPHHLNEFVTDKSDIYSIETGIDLESNNGIVDLMSDGGGPEIHFFGFCTYRNLLDSSLNRYYFIYYVNKYGRGFYVNENEKISDYLTPFK